MVDDRGAKEASDLQRAVALVRAQDARVPEMALVLGSGLGDLAQAVEAATGIPAADLPGYPHATVSGHDGQLVLGELEGRCVLVLRGRVHLYEGHPVQAVAFPVRLARALGAHRLLVTNAAGGINRRFHPGTLVFITGHINMAFADPCVGRARPGETWMGGTSDGAAYDPAWIDRAERLAMAHGLPTRRGVYLWTLGPSYETKAEIRAFGRLGADAVGMSTVPEVLQARRLGMAVLGLSTITNPAAGLSPSPLTHEDVLATGRRVRHDLERLVRLIVRHT